MPKQNQEQNQKQNQNQNQNQNPEQNQEQLPEYKKIKDINFARMIFLGALDAKFPGEDEAEPEIPYYLKLAGEQKNPKKQAAQPTDELHIKRYGVDGNRIPQTYIITRLFSTGRVIDPDTKAPVPANIDAINKTVTNLFHGKSLLVIDNKGKLQQIEMFRKDAVKQQLREQLKVYQAPDPRFLDNLVYDERPRYKDFRSLIKESAEVKAPDLNMSLDEKDYQDNQLTASLKALHKTESIFSQDTKFFTDLNDLAYRYQHMMDMREQILSYACSDKADYSTEHVEKIAEKIEHDKKLTPQIREKFSETLNDIRNQREINYIDITSALGSTCKDLFPQLKQASADYIKHVLNDGGTGFRQRARLEIARSIKGSIETITKAEKSMEQEQTSINSRSFGSFGI